MRPVSRAFALATTLALAVGVLVVPVIGQQPASAAPPTPRAAPELPVCPPPEALAARNAPIGTDANVSVFVGGDYTAGGNAAESEGVLAVRGTARFAKTNGGTFNVGVVGFGSGVVPPPGTDMLRSGADTTVVAPTNLDVGHGVGGNVVAGGTAGPIERIETSGGEIRQADPDPLGPFAGFASTISTKSAQYAGLPSTGTVSAQYGVTTFTGDGSSATQVFDIPGNRLGQATQPTAIRFANIPPDARVIVNVTGTNAGVFPSGFFTDASNAQIDFGDPRFVELATHTMWNFPEAEDVVVGTGDQLLGSVMVPTAGSITRITASTNGRLLIGGDLRFLGEGNEAHSFPFPDDDFECKPTIDPPVATGGLSVRKTVSDPDGVVDPAQEYVGTWSCTAPDGSAIPGGSWRASGDGTPTLVAENLPVGSTCQLAESPPTDPVPDDPSYGWADPVISPSTVTIGDDTVAEVTVANTVERSTGGFAIAKALDDPTGAVDPTRSYVGGWSCTTGGAVVASGRWSVTADGAPQDVSGVPIGAVCSVTEDTPAQPVPGDPSAIWAPPTISPDTITVGDGATPTVTVTNHVEQVTGSFAITKEVAGPGGGIAPGSRFGFTWTCTAPDGTVSGPTLVTVAAGSLTTVPDIVAGSACTVAEGPLPPVEDQSYEWLDPSFTIDDGQPTTGDTASFTIPADGGPVVRVGFTNTIRQQLGVFGVEKVLVDPAGVTRANATYHGTWSCSFNDQQIEDGTFDVTADGAEQTLALGLPYGTRCNAVEDLGVGGSASSDGDRAYQWATPVLDANEVVIGSGPFGAVGIVRITNTVDAVTTSASIAKIVDDPDGVAPADAVYSGTVRCVAPDGTPSERAWSVRAGQPASLLVDGLPDGTACTVDETTPTPPDADHTWEPPVVSPASFVTHVDSEVAVTVSNVLPAVTVPPTEPPTGGGGGVGPGDPGDGTVPPDAGGASRPGGSGGLAFTGAEIAWPAGLALAMLAAGVTLALVRRPRRRGL